jgi:DNA mismatch repair protein MutL
MPRIQQLPPLVITKIAAGEVIERPASVVKELLENSIDAGSSRIDIDIEQGGAELIRVVDNGCGIVPEDLPLAFASHATSKLASADDLFRIGTLGFRGEALASVGSVAQVTLQSRPADQVCGAEVTCHGGTLSPVRDWNGSPGTRIEVRHLFYNTPVRRKFMRAPGTEMGHISETFTRVALAQPGLHLTLRHNDKSVYEVAAATALLERIRLFFGTEVSERLYGVEASHGPSRLFGYVGDPSCERGNAKTQYFFINGRWIRDRSLGHALQEAYSRAAFRPGRCERSSHQGGGPLSRWPRPVGLRQRHCAQSPQCRELDRPPARDARSRGAAAGRETQGHGFSLAPKSFRHRCSCGLTHVRKQLPRRRLRR